MENDASVPAPGDGALRPLAPGALIRIAHGPLAVDIAPAAGGRLAQISHAGVEWLVGHDARHDAMIAWGSYPMLPWVGRIRHGRFVFEGRRYQLPLNLGEHAIHGVGFALPWRVEAQSARGATLSLQLPEDARWPFGGRAMQRFELGDHALRMELTVSAGVHAMPVAIGWHPWFRKPDRLEFAPHALYPRDDEGIATRPLAQPTAGPWDDCFLNDDPVLLHRGGQRLRLTSDCNRWVVYDETAHATCVEPQSGPPDAFNLELVRLSPGESLAAWFQFEWL